ncbi:MAG: T9SS type A sorting domain-containing protein [Bacteroidota bacterium]
MKRIFYTLSLIAFTLAANAQLLSQENFNYTAGQLTDNAAGANVSGGVWKSFSGTGVFIPVIAGSLTYTGYASSVGNKVRLTATTASAEDDSMSFTLVTGGDIYVSFLLNVLDTAFLNINSSANGDYFVNLATNNTTFFSRVSIRRGAVGNTYNLGIRHSSTGITVWAPADYALNTTQLVVLKYSFVAGVTNDQTSLWVNPTLGGSEPTALAVATNVSTADPARISSIALRQGSSAGLGTPNAEIDGIRIGTAWALGALPVTWKSFTATKSADASILRWSTASETNNSHFEIQRSTDNRNFETIGRVKGTGNSSRTVNYSFTDKDATTSRTTYYRLKQVDFDGKADYSRTVSVTNTTGKAGIGSTLPNPFSTDLNINVNAPSATTATVIIMDMIGKTHHTSTEQLQAGTNSIDINTAELPDGIYFVRVSYNGETFTQKIVKK